MTNELSTLLTEDILASLGSKSVCEDDITYEDYINSFNDEEPF